MANTVSTPAGEKDKVQIEQSKEKVEVMQADWAVTAMKVLRIGVYAFITAVAPVLIQMATESTNPIMIIWGPVVAMVIRTLEGYARFHFGGNK